MHHKSSKLLHKKIFFWCCKPLGLYGLRKLVSLKQTKFPNIELAGIGISSKDRCKSKIRAIAKTYWPNCLVYVDNFEVTTNYSIGLCIGFPFKIASSSIDRFSAGVINLHFALLPKYRGSGTLEKALLDGVTEYGLTYHFIDAELDTGDIIFRKAIPVSKNDTYQTMLPKLEVLGKSMIDEWFELFLTTKVSATKQQEIIATEKIRPLFCTRKKTKSYYTLHKSDSFKKIYQQVAALDKGKGSRPYFEHQNKKIFLTLEQ